MKVVMPTVLHDIAWRAVQIHGALGARNEMPFLGMVTGAAVMGLADGPTKVHQDHRRTPGVATIDRPNGTWPTEVDRASEAAWAFADYLEAEVGISGEIDVARLADWMDDAGLPGTGEPLSAHFLSGGTQNVITRFAAAKPACCACRRPVHHPTATRASCGSGASSEALDGTRYPAHRSRRRVYGPRRAGPALLSDGFQSTAGRRWINTAGGPETVPQRPHRPSA